MNRLLIFISLFLTSATVFGQQVPFYNHFLINPFVYNPAFTGSDDYVNASFVRNQRFTSFGSAAVSNYLTVDGKIYNGKMGIGLLAGAQNQGIQQQSMASLSYAYNLKLRESDYLSFGVAGGFLDNRINTAQINVEQSADPYLTGLRPAAPAFNMNAGLAFKGKNLRAGISVPQITGSKVKYAKETVRGYYQLARHYMAVAEYDFHAGENFIIRPNVLARYIPAAPVQYDLSLMTMFRNSVWASATYKAGYAVQINAGFRVFDFLRIGYSYEFLTGTMKSYSTGMNHEIFVGISFRNKKEKETLVVEKEVVVTNTDAVKERDSLASVNKTLEEKLQQLRAEKSEQDKILLQKDSLEKVSKILLSTMVSVDDLPLAKGYRFREIYGSKSPDGYYVVAGVFSKIGYAENQLNKNRVDFPDSYMVINEINNWYYIVIHYSPERESAEKALRRYSAGISKKVWILNYRSP